MQWPLLLKDNAAAAATTLTIRHSRFATLTLAKLVASLALHPPISATEADYAPHPAHCIRHLLLKEKAFIVIHFHPSWPFLPTIPINYAPWHADRRSAQGVHSTTKGESRKRTEESLFSSGRFRLSPATGRSGRWPGPHPV